MKLKTDSSKLRHPLGTSAMWIQDTEIFTPAQEVAKIELVANGPFLPAFMAPDRERRIGGSLPNREVELGFSTGSPNAISGFAGHHDAANPLYDRNLSVCPACDIKRSFFEFDNGKSETCIGCRNRRRP